MKKILEQIKKHPLKYAIVIFLALAIFPPIIVHCIYKIEAPCELLKYVIPPGNLLSYIGTVLTFCATFTLSIMVYISNREREKSEQLLRNRTIITIAENQEVGIDIIDFISKESADIFISLEIVLLSDATLTSIKLRFLTIEEREMRKEKRKFVFDFNDKPQNITFPYINRERTQISLPLNGVKKNIAQFLKEEKSIRVAFDVDFICDRIKTPYVISLDLTKKDNKEDVSIKYCFGIEKMYIHYQNPQIF